MSLPRTSRASRARSAHYHLAVLPLINTVIFPRAVIPLYVNREQSLRAVEAAATNDVNLLAVAQRDGDKESVGPDDLYEIGVEADIAAMNVDEPGWLADLVAGTLDVSVAQRQDVLQTLTPEERLQKVSILLSKELDILELQNRIHTQVQQEVDKSQREYFLREQ